MLDLYHWEPQGASARVLISLAEKGIAFRSHYVDVLALGQHAPPLSRIEPSGEIPVLVCDGAAYTGATSVCELIEELVSAPALMPSEPYGRWQARVWQKSVDDAFGASVSELAWQAYGPITRGSGATDEGRLALEAAVERLVSPEHRAIWRAALSGYGDEQLARARRRIGDTVGRMESALARSPWLAGSDFSLADIAVFAYFKFLPALCPDLVSESATPRAVAWLRAVEDRPAVRASLGLGRAADPFAVAAPAPEQIRWG